MDKGGSNKEPCISFLPGDCVDMQEVFRSLFEQLDADAKRHGQVLSRMPYWALNWRADCWEGRFAGVRWMTKHGYRRI